MDKGYLIQPEMVKDGFSKEDVMFKLNYILMSNGSFQAKEERAF